MPTELKIPIRISATALSEVEEDTKPTKSDVAGGEKDQCCPCPKTKEAQAMEAEERELNKKFENFLHNSVFTPRYSYLYPPAYFETDSGTSLGVPVPGKSLGLYDLIFTKKKKNISKTGTLC